MLRTLLALVRLLALVTITDADNIAVSDGPPGTAAATRTVSVTAASGSVSTTTSSTVDDYTPGPV